MNKQLQARQNAASAPTSSFMTVPTGLLQRKSACSGTPGPIRECEEYHTRNRLSLQSKLKVNAPGDVYEQEADRIADQVLAEPAHYPAKGAPLRIEGFAGQLAGQMDTVPASVDRALTSSGRALEPGLRQNMEQRFGQDFSRVRLHSGTAEAQSARELNANAYTFGRDIVFDAGQLSPSTHEGRRLLAHELVHVVQQQNGSCPQIQRDAQEAESRAWMAPHYPGCSPYDRKRLDFQLVIGRSLVTGAAADLHEELARAGRGAGIITTVQSAFQRHFKSSRPDHMRTVANRLRTVADRLNRGPTNWRCMPTQPSCESACGAKRAGACAPATGALLICPSHFEHGDHIGTLQIVHEAAHQAGMPGDTYSWQKPYATLSTAQALGNADSYTLFVRDNRYGGAIVSPGGPAEAPHERETRSILESHAWTAQEISISMTMDDPRFVREVGHLQGRVQHVPRASARIATHFLADVFFSVDTAGGGIERPRPFTAPAVSLRVTLLRSGSARARGGRPARSVLIDAKDPAARDQGAGSNLRTSFPGQIDLHFDKADRGTLVIDAGMQDFDTATTAQYRETLTVEP